MNNNIVLSGKYELIRCLGCGSTSTVYLARHISLERECAIKIFPKSSDTSLCILSEAQLLRSLHHSGIPEIYDIEEDSQNYYLVEEFIPGESLEEYLLHQKTISQSLFFTYCEQLCDIFAYLHDHKPTPVFYQDLKPEHIIICGHKLKLIDFGVSDPIVNSGKCFKQYGNLDFSAPEYISGRSISIAADIYSLGKLMEYLTRYLREPVPHTISQIIQKATMPDAALRYETVQALILALQSAKNNNCQPHLLKTIAIVGSTAGCGATHIAITLVSTLNTLGYPCFYYEKNESRCLQNMSAQLKHMTEKPEGYYSYKNFQGFPEYGPGIRISIPQNAMAVEDYGSDLSAHDLGNADLIVLICPDAIWSRNHAIEKTKFLKRYSKPLLFLCNPGKHAAALYYAKQFSTEVYPFFNDSDPFRVDARKETFTRQLLTLPEKGRSFPFSNIRRQKAKSPFV